MINKQLKQSWKFQSNRERFECYPLSLQKNRISFYILSIYFCVMEGKTEMKHPINGYEEIGVYRPGITCLTLGSSGPKMLHKVEGYIKVRLPFCVPITSWNFIYLFWKISVKNIATFSGWSYQLVRTRSLWGSSPVRMCSWEQLRPRRTGRVSYTSVWGASWQVRSWRLYACFFDESLEQILSKRGIYQNRTLFKFSPAYRSTSVRHSRH